ncbi:hypothetical protein BABINDRAFT_97710 [Babjeviella inositovora NRRL Y-12698]|uniref:Uncharacterized protein n=1 Tax=Babjeviella inositovora NRRL Y-12698 TaxID=984486 RepID=A0A1E3QJ34_9ASCO|nr:uncharacterized protein BABINDRAFT_97710 [Babjeviella inositovora NRRL Y-12698]ODQ77716.1 hypothetical protein BABINDRAFT_97710 [Babjeviella inositovora NRRL Y-12698]
MWWPSVLCFSLALVLALYGINKHIRVFRQKWYLALALSVAIYIPVSIIFLLPIDLISSQNSADANQWFQLPARVIAVCWRSTYWTAFFLTWTILPVLQEFYDSGHHKPMLRLKDSLRTNLKYQLAMLVAGLLGLLYLVFSVGLTFASLKSLVIALSHSYSLILALWFMSYGLVNLPRDYWLLGSPQRYLNRCYVEITTANDTIEDLKYGLQEISHEIERFRAIAQEDYDLQFEFGEWLVDLQRQLPDEATGTQPLQTELQKLDLTTKRIVDLSRRLHHKKHRFILAICDLEKGFQDVVKFEDIQEAAASRQLHFRYTQQSKSMRLLSKLLSPKALYFCYQYAIPLYNRFASVLICLLSIIVVESEMLHSTKFSLVNLLLTAAKQLAPVKFVISVVMLTYMCMTSVLSLRKNKLFNLKYHLNDGGLSDPVSCLFYATYACRLTLPLSYNFLTLLVDRSSGFELFLGKSINLTVLGEGFNSWLPRFILVPLVFNYFNLFEKIKDKLGFNMLDYDEDDLPESRNGIATATIEEARHVVNKHMAKLNAETNPNLRAFRLSTPGRHSPVRSENFSESIDNLANMQYNQNRSQFNESLMRREEESFPPVAETNSSGGMWTSLKSAVGGVFTSSSGRVQIPSRDSDDEDLVL